MDVEEYLDYQTAGQHCRLCLHWTDAPFAEQLVDIFSFNENLNSTIADKIQECLGLNIGPDETVSNICLNCVHTISFMNEFRTLCQQTEKLCFSAQIRFNDVLRWKNFNDHVNELRMLVRGQRDWVDNILDDVNVGETAVVSVGIDNTCSPEFIEMEDETENQDEQLEEYIDEEPLSEVENIVDPCESVAETNGNPENSKPPTIPNRASRFLLKLEVAHELQAQMAEKPDFKAVSRNINVGYYEVKLLWGEMRDLYNRYKKRALEGHKAYILRCRRCPLFTVMNILVPKFSGDEPYIEPKIDTPIENDRDKAIDLQVAIAEEIKAHPELWDLSRNSSSHAMDNAWKEMTRKFEMDIRTLREHWHRLRNFYRTYKVRELKGVRKQNTANEKYDYLLTLLHETIGSTMVIQLPESSIKETDLPEEEELFQQEQQLALVQEVQKHPIIWRYKHPDFHNNTMREQTWEKIADLFAINCESIKRDWSRLRDIFRNRYLRLFKGQLQSFDPLVITAVYKALDGMFRENMRMGSENEQTTDEQCGEGVPDEHRDPDKKFDKETLFEFAKVCHDNDILWNTDHPDYNARDKRNEVWDLIALQFGVSLEKIKFEWKSLRNMYRRRCWCVQKGSTKKTDRLLKTPLHQLMKDMFEEYMHNLGANPKRQRKGSETMLVDTDNLKLFSTPEEQMKLVEEISMHDMLWNVRSSYYKKSALHEPVYVEIAEKFACSPTIIKEEWKKLRRTHKYRQRRIASNVNQIQDEVEPLHSLLDTLLAPSSISTGDDLMNAGGTYKRRFTRQRKISNDGSVRIEVNGETRYVKVCELCGKQVERSRFEYHMNVHNGLRPYACSFEGCGKQFCSKTQRDRHEIEIHSEDGYIFQCDQCEEKFKQKAKYEYHYAIKHKSEEVPCDICGKLLKHRKLLWKHKEVHKASYECPVCGKVLQKKYSLSVHMRVHTKEKPYPCELCDKRFMLKVQMKTHLLKVHSVVLEELEAIKAANKS